MSTEPEAGELLPNLVDRIASSTPDAVWAEYPASATTYDGGFKSITYQQLSNATHAIAHHLARSVRRGSGVHFPTLAYIGPVDARYSFLLIGAIRAGMKIFFTSPRNSIPAQLKLLEQVKCDILLVPDPQPPPVAALLKECTLRVVSIPSLNELLATQPEHFSYNCTYEKNATDEVFVLHTSGSTGVPKALTYTHEYINFSVEISRLPPTSDAVSFNASLLGKRIILFLPPFHIAGVYFGIINAIYNQAPVIWPLPGAIPSAASLADVLANTKAHSAFLSPATLEELAKNTILLDEIAPKLELLFFSGAALPESATLAITSRVPVLPFYGSSEYGAWPMLLPAEPRPPTESHYIRLHPAIGAKMRHRTADLFELVLPFHPTRRQLLPPFLHYPNVRAYHTRDLFCPHPTQRGYWAYRGRVDDIIVFLNGEKTNPIEFEGHVASHPNVNSCLVLGSGKAEAAILVEVSKDVQNEPHRVVDRIWDVVQEANQRCPAHARVAKDRILVTAKPFARAGKGTVQRAATLSLFAEAIEDMYNSWAITNMHDIKPDTKVSITTKNVSELVSQVSNISELGGDDNFFELGMDSLQVLQLVREIKKQLGKPVEPSTVMLNPTVEQLTTAIAQAA